MHVYDHNGTKHRAATDGQVLFGVGFLCSVIFILTAASIIANHYGW